ncbi:MFS transporter [Microbacteriaceae bacterium VKM Ac-2855]|nr:MFS transporter [Microbacteriaceae bacterium VKM Ac-2855]
MSRAGSVGISTFLLGLQQALLIPYLSLFAVQQLELSPVGLLLFLGAFHGTGLIVSLAIPARVDRSANAHFWFKALTLLAVPGFLLFAVPVPPIAAIVVAGLLLGPASAQNSVFFAALTVSGASRSSLLSTRGLFTIAWVIGPLAASVVEALAGFSGLFVTLALVNIVVLVQRPLRRQQASAPRPASSAQPHSPRVSRKVILGFVALVSLHASNVVATTTMPIVVAGMAAGDTGIAGVAFATSAAFEAVVLFALARWSLRRHERAVILLGCIPGAAYYVILASTGSPWAVVAAQLLNAAFISVAVGIGMTWFQSLMPARPGLATGLFMNASRIASLGTAPLIAATAAATHSYQPVSWLALALLSPAVMILLLFRRTTLAREGWHGGSR